MLSAFVSIPAVKMDWIISGVKIVATVSTKMAVNAVAPGWGAAVNFAAAAYDLKQGDKVGAAINVVSGVADVVTLGLSGSIQGAMKEGAKKSTEQGAKELAKKTGKEATKKYGQEVGRQLAQGTFRGGKEAAVKYAPAVGHLLRKKATKEFGERLGKEIAQGLISTSVEKVFKEGTEKAMGGFVNDLLLKLISTAGDDVKKRIFEVTFENQIRQVISEAMKQKPNLPFVFSKIAEKGALKEFLKHVWKIIAKTGVFACVKGGINYIGNDEPEVGFSQLYNTPTEISFTYNEVLISVEETSDIIEVIVSITKCSIMIGC